MSTEHQNHAKEDALSQILISLAVGLTSTAVPWIKTFGGKSFVVYVGMVVAGLAVVGLHSVVRRALEWRADRRMVRRLLAQEPGWSRRDWTLAAPESYMLLQGIRRASRDGFKLGLLQLVAAGVLRPYKTCGEIILSVNRGPAPVEAVTGSLAAIYNLGVADSTIKGLAGRAKQEYGSLDGFGTKIVLPELVKAGLYSLNPAALTPGGEAARADLESRMAGVLREMQLRRGSGVGRKPRQALMAAVIAVAVGGRMPSEETELQLVGMQVEQGAAMRHDTSGQSDMWFDWHVFNDFDRYFQAMDSEVEAGGSWGDGGGGGDD